MPLLARKEPFTVKRYERTLNDDGVWVTTEVDEFTIARANLQPLTSEELSQFPEGFRKRARFKWYVPRDADLRIGGLDLDSNEDNEPDRVVVGLKLLHVHGQFDYSNGARLPFVGHRKLILLAPETEIGGEDPDG